MKSVFKLFERFMTNAVSPRNSMKLYGTNEDTTYQGVLLPILNVQKYYKTQGKNDHQIWRYTIHGEVCIMYVLKDGVFETSSVSIKFRILKIFLTPFNPFRTREIQFLKKNPKYFLRRLVHAR